MTSKEALVKFLRSIDGKAYSRYRELSPSYDMDGPTLYIDKIQNEPSSASYMRVRISFAMSGFPDDAHDTGTKEIALRDLIARRFWESCRTFAKGNSGGNQGGAMSIPRPGQEILGRSSVVASGSFIEVRFKASLPSAGRNVAGKAAEKMLADDLIEIVKASLFFSSYKRSKVYNHLNTAVTAQTIRSALRERGLTAFIADGSILPRREDGLAPMIGAVPFTSPDCLRTSFATADGNTVEGMGIPEGITAVIGATGHGRSTLIDAISSGVYDHIPGDGRELVITVEDAAVVTGDIGRSVKNADVSLFMSDTLHDVRSISSDNADDALSSAVSASEALEIGSGLLLMDDTSVNHGLLYCDDEINSLLPEGDEKMIPVKRAVRQHGLGISVIYACRHSDALDADTAIMMSGHTAIRSVRSTVTNDNTKQLLLAERMPISKNMDMTKGRKDVNSIALSSFKMEFGETVIKIPRPVADVCQMAAIADAMIPAKDIMDGTVTMKELTKRLEEVQRNKINSAEVNAGPDMAVFRKYDIAAVINRHPEIVVAQKRPLR
ncbi:MAG: ABC-ATPase domain-containing protein [Methanomassiliicoccaceae archaeon]|nr:ABC-ATPase domain-containing protein [Methanomassiliicoccaceae archaeon]